MFPNNFSELEELENGSFLIVSYDGKTIKTENCAVKMKNIFFIEIDATGKQPELITSEIMQKIKHENVKDAIVMIKISGTLLRGKTSDINFREIEEEAKRAKCYSLMRNTSGLESPEFIIKVNLKSENVDEIEKEVISKQKNDDFSKFTELLIKSMEIEKLEGEKTETFEKRLFEEFSKIVGVELK